MKITDEAKQLRIEVAKLRPDKRRRYGDVLRARILDWVASVEADGGTASECSQFLGIKTWRFQMWRNEAKVAAAGSGAIALVPIEITGMRMSPTIVLISRGGHRVEGLSIEQIIVVLREIP
jgi:hypothetical protein